MPSSSSTSAIPETSAVTVAPSSTVPVIVTSPVASSSIALTVTSNVVETFNCEAVDVSVAVTVTVVLPTALDKNVSTNVLLFVTFTVSKFVFPLVADNVNASVSWSVKILEISILYGDASSSTVTLLIVFCTSGVSLAFNNDMKNVLVKYRLLLSYTRICVKYALFKGALASSKFTSAFVLSSVLLVISNIGLEFTIVKCVIALSPLSAVKFPTSDPTETFSYNEVDDKYIFVGGSI